MTAAPKSGCGRPAISQPIADSRERPAPLAELLACPFCGEKTYLSVSDIDGWIASVACDGCDMRGPMSEWKYQDVEESKVDALNRWAAAWNTRTAVEGMPTIWEDPAGKGYPCFERPMTPAECRETIDRLSAQVVELEDGYARGIEDAAKVAVELTIEGVLTPGFADGAASARGQIAAAIRLLSRERGQ